MDQLAVTIVGGVAVLVLAKASGLGGNTVKIITVGRGSSSNKQWKWVILIAWLMLIGGACLFSANNGQFKDFATNNLHAMLGIGLIELSVPVWLVGQIGAWLNS